MGNTYDVRIWKTEVYKGARGNTYWVRWGVAGKPWKEPFKQKALAESFRSELVSAARKGEAFDTESGRPVSMRRAAGDMSWYEFACAYVDMKWPRVAATTRRTHAEALTAVTTAMFVNDKGKPDDKLIRSALCRWAFNTNKRNDPDCPSDIRSALRWVQTHTRPVSALSKPEVLRPVLDALTVRLDGGPAAPSVVSRKRKILNAAAEYAVEVKLLSTNPIPALKWTAPKTVHAVDRRSVANPIQARTLLNAVRAQQRSGPRLVAFFGCLYFAALRPEEAVSLARHNLALPAEGWGELHLDVAEPHAGKEWTDSGKNRDRRQLKQRARGEIRTVPCPPELTALLHEHIDRFGTAPDGRLFTGERNHGELPKLTIVRAWQRARAEVFAPEVAASPLARTPYDLRHAAVSTWLNGGVPPTQVAEWAGHSVEILLKIYAKCLDGGGEVLRQRIQAALGHPMSHAG
ncbi:tyrosine-type recombinase/integrase [Planosporangium mesophilum]|uniref:Integrase n=1 Tax=Planosporangium mesophilum TaxID=689768 RepID=A0A8J3WZ51_9ACTN|nr:tyrosine-type recombinase/integrase [Planosporangium mesophilum]NJC81504.1 tyrosine-type recombinase/integrase [Planosporangium mesophilum]GII20839.1 integrase [Planosporangium mesophilum]